MTESSAPLLDVRDLHVTFPSPEGEVRAVDGVSFTLQAGEVLGIVGESGSGKSVTAQALMGLLQVIPRIRLSGSIRYRGHDVVRMSERQMRHLRGNEMAMIFQDPMTSLNPIQRIETQIAEVLREHMHLPRHQIRERAIELMRRVGIPHAEERLRDYPHQFSGGMRQRVMIAMALACNPSLLIADEPTTALDVTVQSQILQLIKELKNEFGSAVIIITHDLGVIADIADRVLVMYSGRIVEAGDTRQLFYDPLHPYSWGLLGSIPSIDQPRVARLPAIPGLPPSTAHLPAGCTFRPRCDYAFDRCIQEPELTNTGTAPDHVDRCWLSLEEKRQRRPVPANDGAMLQ